MLGGGIMAYLFLGLLIIGIPFYLIWYFVQWICFSDNPNSKWAERWESLVWVFFTITILSLSFCLLSEFMHELFGSNYLEVIAYETL